MNNQIKQLEINIKKACAKTLNDTKVMMLDKFDQNFQSESFFGDKWDSRSKINPFRHDILFKTGNLRRSLKGKIQGNKVIISSSRLVSSGGKTYNLAQIHNEGSSYKVTYKQKGFFKWKAEQLQGKMTSKTSKARYSAEAEFYLQLSRMEPGKEIKIPKRQFLGWNKTLESEITKIFNRNLKHI